MGNQPDNSINCSPRPSPGDRDSTMCGSLTLLKVVFVVAILAAVCDQFPFVNKLLDLQGCWLHALEHFNCNMSLPQVPCMLRTRLQFQQIQCQNSCFVFGFHDRFFQRYCPIRPCNKLSSICTAMCVNKLSSEQLVISLVKKVVINGEKTKSFGFSTILVGYCYIL